MQAAQSRYQSDLGLTPVPLGNQENIEVRPECTANVCEQEVNRVERKGVERLSFDVTPAVDLGNSLTKSFSAMFFSFKSRLESGFSVSSCAWPWPPTWSRGPRGIKPDRASGSIKRPFF